MKKTNLLTLCKLLAIILPWTGFASVQAAEEAATAEDIFIAGVHPERRPVNAPMIQKVEKARQWYDQAVSGISPPFPASFRFLDDQGRWYTPFNRPGMPPPYDIRGWYSEEKYPLQ
ncbi:MAG: hypothetical protein SVR94_04245 [Pseudomonadota bacterium]|nr:hypothetical protein [Pseudomonadota bacterium]